MWSLDELSNRRGPFATSTLVDEAGEVDFV